MWLRQRKAPQPISQFALVGCDIFVARKNVHSLNLFHIAMDFAIHGLFGNQVFFRFFTRNWPFTPALILVCCFYFWEKGTLFMPSLWPLAVIDFSEEFFYMIAQSSSKKADNSKLRKYMAMSVLAEGCSPLHIFAQAAEWLLKAGYQCFCWPAFLFAHRP